MALTDFGAQKPEVIFDWKMKAYQQIRDALFFKKYQGSNGSNVVERIKNVQRGAGGGITGAMMHLNADLPTGAIQGDNSIVGRASKIQSYWISTEVDQLARVVENTGRLDDQGSVDNFRTIAKDKLARVLAKTWDEFHFLAVSGISFSFNTNGSTRVITPDIDDPLLLKFASGVQPPTSNRYFVWDGSTLQQGVSNATITATYLPNYKMITAAISAAQSQRLPPLYVNGREHYVLLVRPETMMQLRNDETFIRAIVHAMPRGEDNPIFTGATITLDGAIIAVHNDTFNTKGASAGNKWGAGGAVDGTRTLLLGAQALGYVDAEPPDWNEELIEGNRRKRILVQQIGAVFKPQFYSIYTGQTEDYGVMAIDHAIL